EIENGVELGLVLLDLILFHPDAGEAANALDGAGVDGHAKLLLAVLIRPQSSRASPGSSDTRPAPPRCGGMSSIAASRAASSSASANSRGRAVAVIDATSSAKAVRAVVITIIAPSSQRPDSGSSPSPNTSNGGSPGAATSRWPPATRPI